MTSPAEDVWSDGGQTRGEGDVVVVIDGQSTHVVGPAERLTFGRADLAASRVIGLDAEDRSISRRTCSLEPVASWWAIVNHSTKTQVVVFEAEFPDGVRLRPGGRHLINQSPCTVQVRGLIRTHRLDIAVPPGQLASTTVVGGQETDTLSIELSMADRDALTALVAGYLETIPRHDPRPRSYQEAAEILGVPSSTVRRRIERLRERLREHGWYIEGHHARYELAELALERRWVTADDLVRIKQRNKP